MVAQGGGFGVKGPPLLGVRMLVILGTGDWLLRPPSETCISSPFASHFRPNALRLSTSSPLELIRQSVQHILAQPSAHGFTTRLSNVGPETIIIVITADTTKSDQDQL